MDSPDLFPGDIRRVRGGTTATKGQTKAAQVIFLYISPDCGYASGQPVAGEGQHCQVSVVTPCQASSGAALSQLAPSVAG